MNWRRMNAIACALGLFFFWGANAQSQTGKLRPVAVEASSHYAEHMASRLIDGSLKTKWAALSPPEMPAWVLFDFAEVVEISEIVVQHAEAGGETPNLNTEDFRFERADAKDGPWIPIAQEVDNLYPTTKTIFSPVRTRFIRMVVTDAMSMVKPNTKNDDDLVRIFEVEFTGQKTGGAGAAAQGLAPSAGAVSTPSSSASASQPSPVGIPFVLDGGVPPPPLAGVPIGNAPSVTTPQPTPPGAILVAGVPWFLTAQEAHRHATAEKKQLLVFLRSPVSRWQSEADAILANADLLKQLSPRAVFLVLDAQKDPQAAVPFRTYRFPSVTLWSTEGTELKRLEGAAITLEGLRAWAQ